MIVTKKNRLLIVFTLLLGSLSWHSCVEDNGLVYTDIPDGPVNLTINLDLPLHFHLNNMGTFAYFAGGHKGVLLIHNFDDQFYAFERTCTHQPDLSCSRVEVDSLLLDIRCGSYEDGQWTECCTSRFFFNGQVEQGPAQLPLKQFSTAKNGSILTVRN